MAINVKRKIALLKQLFREAIMKGTKAFIFGVIDQGIMVACGDAMDAHVKAILGLAGATGTIVAAGIGNAISDSFGEGSASTIKSWLEKMGLKDQQLTKEESKLLRFRLVHYWSPVVGIFLGCIVGLVVLPIKRMITG